MGISKRGKEKREKDTGKNTKKDSEKNILGKNIKEIILKHVLKNALDFQGKANAKAVLGPVLREDEELKKDVPKTLKEIETAVKEVEKLSLEDIRKELQHLAPELLQEKKEEGEEVKGPLKPLPNAVQGKVVTRIAPSPSGPLHIGHAYGASLNYEYAKMYGGKLILRIEDTNPENIYKPAYKLIEEDVQWLTGNQVAQVVIQSSRLGIYYDYAEKLVSKGRAYVCTCNSDQWRELKNNGQACPCRNLNEKENQLRYAKMFNEYAEGEAVLRLKTEIKHPNPAMRDFAIMRVNEHLHPLTGKEQKVWPLMIFAVAIDDHELGVTHVLNGKDHADNGKKEALIMNYLGWKPPEYQHWGRINFEGFKLSTSETRLAIEQNEYEGWEDLRLPFLPALRRRGYQPEAFRRYALETGLSLNDKTVSREEFWKNINAFNKEIIEPKANRYFFVDAPVEVKITNAPQRKVEISLHPDFPEKGKRIFQTDDTFFISESDFKRLGEGCLHRLMDCGNFQLKGNKFVYVSRDYQDYKEAKNQGQIIHWLPGKGNVKAAVLLETGDLMAGLGEESLGKLKPGTIVQLERRFFASIAQDKSSNKNKDKIIMCYLHK